MESIYIALFNLSSKRFDTHYTIDQVGINLKPSQLPGKYTVRLPVIRRLKTSILAISCTVWYWYRVPFYCRVDRRDSGEIWTRELSHGKRVVSPLRHRKYWTRKYEILQTLKKLSYLQPTSYHSKALCYTWMSVYDEGKGGGWRGVWTQLNLLCDMDVTHDTDVTCVTCFV